MKKIAVLWIAFLIAGFLASCSKHLSYPSEEAIKNGDIVNAHGEISGLDRLEEFKKKVTAGTKDHIQITSYTKEGDPIFERIVYDGKKLFYTYDPSHDQYGSSRIQKDTCRGMSLTDSEEEKEYRLVGCRSEIGKYFSFQVNK